MPTDKEVGGPYSAYRRSRIEIPCGVTYENGVPVFHPPKAVSGSEMKSDPRLKRPRIQGGWKVGF